MYYFFLYIGGSNGLGRALCAELVKRGARVIVACRTRARSDSTAYFLRNKTGSFNLRTIFVDLQRLDSVLDFCRELVDTEDKIDAVVNNAGEYNSAKRYPKQYSICSGYSKTVFTKRRLCSSLNSRKTQSIHARFHVVCVKYLVPITGRFLIQNSLT